MPPSYAVLTCTAVSLECPVEATVYGHYPNLPVNATFAAIFFPCLIAQLGLGYHYKTRLYVRFVSVGCLTEMIGYIGRCLLHNSPWSNTGFEMQICCLITAPAMMADGIYITLKHLNPKIDPESSRLPAKWYTPIFVSGDSICLIIQAVGGAIAGTSLSNLFQLATGSNIMLAGITMQVIVSLLFITLASIYACKVYAKRATLSSEATTFLRSIKFRLYLSSIVVAFLAIFIRCVYRIGEMAKGWDNPIMRDEAEVIVLDGMCVFPSLETCAYWQTNDLQDVHHSCSMPDSISSGLLFSADAPT